MRKEGFKRGRNEEEKERRKRRNAGKVDRVFLSFLLSPPLPFNSFTLSALPQKINHCFSALNSLTRLSANSHTESHLT